MVLLQNNTAIVLLKSILRPTQLFLNISQTTIYDIIQQESVKIECI